MKEILLDWIEFTSFEGIAPEKNIMEEKEILEDVQNVLKMDLSTFKKLDKSLYGYENRLFKDNINILYGATNPNMRVHVSMTGKGVRAYEQEHSSIDMIKRVVNKEKHNFTRIDLACDIKNEGFSFDTLKMYIDTNSITTRFKRYRYMEQNEIHDDGIKNTGKTIYFGSNTSDIYIKFYDKGKEQGTGEDWIRCEITLKDERANAVALLINQNIRMGNIFFGILNNYLKFVEKTGKDTNKRRWKTAPFWEEFIEDVKPLKLTEKGEIGTLEDTRKWVCDQVAPSLAMLKAYDSEQLERIVNEGYNRLTSKHLIKLDAAMKKMPPSRDLPDD